MYRCILILQLKMHSDSFYFLEWVLEFASDKQSHLIPTLAFTKKYKSSKFLNLYFYTKYPIYWNGASYRINMYFHKLWESHAFFPKKNSFSLLNFKGDILCPVCEKPIILKKCARAYFCNAGDYKSLWNLQSLTGH